ncbi:MAG TPA: asparagine synthase (glutamine-hydrolyzing) [Candidatus Acidoferrales bacterium]|nr:asparagine synthase (glutamine-hydrolyzing) [Candidatus Acidoferrales bacterium]
MCGICGIIGKEEQAMAAERVRAMMHAMVHRGPDGQGFLAAPGVSIGMRRLSIIDLPGGQQPIWNEDRTLALIFNGEIYNFRELRSLLERHGHIFSTQSDTEVILHSYEMWGSECVRHLRGMFAFALVEFSPSNEKCANRVFLARDRLGIKPLYYALAEGNFLFSSEVRSLLASGSIPRRLNAQAVSGYLLFGCACEPVSLIEGIRSVPPGHCGYVSADEPLSFSPEPYWSASDAIRPVHSRLSPAEQVRADLEDSVRCHLIADVPVGVFLSSGLDSTVLAAVAARQNTSIKTFTLAFTEQDFSEAALARATAGRLGTEHSELLLTGEDMLSRLDEAMRGFDQPSADGINTYFIAWAARQAGLKVALSGLGSDELFGGYSTFQFTRHLSYLLRAARLLPRSIRRKAAAAALLLNDGNRQSDPARKAASAFLQPDDAPHPYFFNRMLLTREAVAALRGSSESWKESGWWQWFASVSQEARQLDSFTAVSWLETRSYLVNMLLRDTDTMSMRNSFEVRVPFLDDPLLRTVLSCPERNKKQKGVRKALLAKAVRDLVPADLIRQPKRTFTLPWEVWLRGALRERVFSSLTNCDPHLAEIIDIGAVLNVWQDFLTGRRSWSRPWAIFVLNEWTKRNITEAPKSFVSEHKAAAPAIG